MPAARDADAALSHVFGAPFDGREAHPELRFLYEHPLRVAEDALALAFRQEADGQWLPHRLSVDYRRSVTLNAATVDIGPGHSVIVLSHVFPLALFEACLAVVPRMDVGRALPECDEIGQLIVYADRARLARFWPNLASAGANAGSDLDRHLLRLLHELGALGRLPHATLLYDMAIRFVVMHECMHIVLGHTGYLRRARQVPHMLEMGASRRRALTADVSQALEFIADRHAVHGVAHWVRSSRLGEYADEVCRDVVLPRELYLMRLYTLSLMMLLLLFPCRPTARASRNDMHPHPYTRMRWLCREIGQGFPSRELHIQGVLEPMAYWTASFLCNFSTIGRWQRAVEEDEAEGDAVPPLSDRAYEAVTEVARQWQTRLWENYSPVYPGDGRTLMPGFTAGETTS